MKDRIKKYVALLIVIIFLVSALGSATAKNRRILPGILQNIVHKRTSKNPFQNIIKNLFTRTWSANKNPASPRKKPNPAGNTYMDPPLGDEFVMYHNEEIAVLGYLNPAGYLDSVKLMEADGSTYQDWKSFQSKYGYYAMDSGDFDGDGEDEIALLEHNDNIIIQIYDPGNPENDKTIHVKGVFPHDITCGDFNGDGKDEIAILGGDFGEPKTYKIVNYNGNELTDWFKIYYKDSCFYRIDAGDVNGDGKYEIIATSASHVYIRNKVLNGEEYYIDTKVFDAKCKNIKDVSCGDINGNKKDDILLTEGSNKIKILDGNGNTVFGWKKPPKGGGSKIDCGDFDKDGDQEIVLLNSLGMVEVWDPQEIDENPYTNQILSIGKGYNGWDITCGDFDNSDGISVKYTGEKKENVKTDWYPVALMYFPPFKKGLNDDPALTFTTFGKGSEQKTSDVNNIGVEATWAVSFNPTICDFFTPSVKASFKHRIEKTYGTSLDISYITYRSTGKIYEPYVVVERTRYNQYKYKIMNGEYKGEDFVINVPIKIEENNFQLSYYNENRGDSPKLASHRVTGDPTSYVSKYWSNEEAINTDWYYVEQGHLAEGISINEGETEGFKLEDGRDATFGLSTYGFGYQQTEAIWKSYTHYITVAKQTYFKFGLDGIPGDIYKKWLYKFKMCIWRDPTYKYIVMDYLVDPDSLGWGYKGDHYPPSVSINSPEEGLYLYGRKLMPLKKDLTIIIGNKPSDIRAYAYDNKSGIESVKLKTDFGEIKGRQDGDVWTFGNCIYSGKHNYTVIAKDEAGNVAVDDITILCILGNSPPFLTDEISGPDKVTAGHRYTCSVPAIDAEGDNIYCKFDWGDGTNTHWIGPFKTTRINPKNYQATNLNPTILKASHSWSKTGAYKIVVSVKDEHGNMCLWNENKEINVYNKNAEPTAIAGGPYKITKENPKVTFDASQSHDNDENGKEIKWIRWDFDGDG
ncbi:MAG: VCBS repeat-containing protein, partial [Thermoplasmata archaeon]|nr:VCBS repeat-containing protein [Thermoplasmata archaeon]